MIQGSTSEAPIPGADLTTRWAALSDAQPGLRIRDAADRLGVSEAALVATCCGAGATRLRCEAREILAGVGAVGPVMGLTRNDWAVLERDGVYGEVLGQGPVGLILGEDIDLRLFFTHWRHAFAVDTVSRGKPLRSLQFFDGAGQAVHKIYLRPGGDEAAWDALIARFTHADQGQTFHAEAPPEPIPDRPDDEIDLASFRAGWLAMTDTHQFHGLLKAHGVGRLQALRLAPEGMACPLGPQGFPSLMTQASESGLPVMIFVGSPGAIQIHTGPIHRLVERGSWFNVLDPTFNLHLRMDAVAVTWMVRKPTSDGVVTSVELFDRRGQLIALVFGARKPGQREREDWRAMAESLS